MITKNKFLKSLLSSFFLVFLIFSFPVDATTFIPQATSYKYLNDYVGVINDSDSKRIVSIGKELEDKTGSQAVVVVIDSTNGVSIEDYAIKLFRNWGIGQKNKDNGLLILLSVNDKAWRVEVGRGLEGAIPDALSNRVMESIAKPNFINGSYGEGLVKSYSVLSDYIANEYGTTLDKSLHITLPNNPNNAKSNNNVRFGGGIIVILFLIDIIFNRGRVSSTVMQLIFLSNLGRRNGPRGGSGGGGLGGFGGGSSNGGGSSGRW